MAVTLSGIFSVREFNYRRNVLKIAPDAFVTINGAFGARVVAPLETSGSAITDVRGGVTSISVSCAVNPAGSSRANIEVVAPQYKGLHTDYYITLPNGTRTNIFTPMMEVKIYMKGRYIEESDNWTPKYYPVFWGMITGVQENYTSGATSFTITCEDLLCWWKYQKVNIQSSVANAFFGGAGLNRFPSAFKNMSAWEIIMALFSDTFFVETDTKGENRRLDFLFPQFTNINQLPDNIQLLRDTWGPFSQKVIDYWNNRFGFGVSTNKKDTPQQIADSLRQVPLEMYGMRGLLPWNVLKERVLSFLDPTKEAIANQTDINADLDLDFGMLARVQPYGLFANYGDGAQPTVMSKLEIANIVCEKVNMEFFVDTNGSFVFKPPLYNLDVATGGVSYYIVGPEDIINFNSNFDSNAIINYLVVTGPLWQQFDMEAVGLHADFESIKRFGLHSEQVAVPFGMNSNQLKMIAVAEMTRRNGQAYTGSLSMPLRPEMRLGYPVYLPHIDTFYYVTGLSHSYAYGSSATTDLSLQYRRERMFEDGTSGLVGFGSEKGEVLSACVMRERKNIVLTSAEKVSSAVNAGTNNTPSNNVQDPSNSAYTKNADNIEKQQKEQDLRKEKGLYSGPDILGYWSISKAVVGPYKNAVQNPGTPEAIVANELVMISDTTVPYTDKNGYRHIGAFPFGSNLVLMNDLGTYDATNKVQAESVQVKTVLGAKANADVVSAPGSVEKGRDVPGRISQEGADMFQTTPLSDAQLSDRVAPAPADSTFVDYGMVVGAGAPSENMPRGNINGTTIQRVTQ